MNTQRYSLFICVVFMIGAAASAAAGGGDAARTPGGSSPFVIPAGGFVSDGDTVASYFIAGEYVAGGTGVHLRAPIYLPPGAFITQITVMALDENSSNNAHFYFHETPFGVLGADNEFLHLQTSASSASFQYLTASDVDHPADPVNKMYWVEAFLPGSDIRLYSVHVFYDDDVLFADGFESGNTERWDIVATMKAWTEYGPEEAPAVPGQAQTATPEIPEWMQIDNLEVREAFVEAMSGTKAYLGSPLVLPGAAFKSTGSIEWDTFFIHPAGGYLYPKSGDTTTLMTPVNLPNGATISFVMFFFQDTDPGEEIGFRLSRMNVFSGAGEDLLAETSTGSGAGIRSATFTSADLSDPVVVNNFFSYWLTVDLDGTNVPSSYFHTLYAVVILYTLP